MKTLKKIAPFILIGIVCFGAIFFVFVLRSPNTLPFRHVNIMASDNHISSSDLQNAVTDHVHGGFFSLNVNELRASLLKLPWVYQVSFRRVWPDQLEVDVLEQQPVARWNTDRLINVHGEVFRPPFDTIPKGLPVLEGPEEALPEMLQRYHQFSQWLAPLGVKITEMQMTSRHTVKLTLDGRIQVILGRENVEQHVLKLIDLYPKLIANRADQVEYIDCRYPNGFSVKWRDNIRHAITK